jgi:hypothetical protein
VLKSSRGAPTKTELAMTISALRAGATASHWSDDPSGERLTHLDQSVVFYFDMPSKGGGVTAVRLQVTGDSFGHVATEMMEADYEAASKAFASAGYQSAILEAMMADDEPGTIRLFGRLLAENKDAILRACGAILLNKVGV